MKGLDEFSDDFICDIVKSGRRTLSNNDFEDQVMLKIHAEVNYRNVVSSQLKTSLRFFIGAVGLGVGLVIIVLFGDMHFIFSAKIVEIIALFMIAIIGVLNIDNYFRLISKYTV